MSMNYTPTSSNEHTVYYNSETMEYEFTNVLTGETIRLSKSSDFSPYARTYNGSFAAGSPYYEDTYDSRQASREGELMIENKKLKKRLKEHLKTIATLTKTIEEMDNGRT